VSTKTLTIPPTFMLGAAASAWQTEGWSGKKEGRIHGPIFGTKTTGRSGMRAMARRWRLTFITVFAKTYS
jgi:hypothetical protein